MIFPMPLPDEILGSLLARMARMNGFADFRDMSTSSIGHGPVSSFIDAEINLSRDFRYANFAFRGADEVLERMTWCRVLVSLGELGRERFEAMVRGDVLPTLGALTFSDSAVLGFCPTCRERDLGQYGMSYWHRLHQLPIVFFCPYHGDRVVKMRIKRFTLHKEFPVPSDFELDLNNSEIMSGLNENFWRGVAAMVAEALQGGELPDTEIMFSTLADELRRKKFVLPLSGVRLTALAEQIAAQAFENQFSTNWSAAVAFLKRIARSFDEPEAGMILGRIVLLYWLIGGWEAVRLRCLWRRVFGSESNSPMRKAASTRSKFEVQYRRVCTAYLRKYPECTRLDFLKAEYRSFRWLLHNDRVWLDRQLPIPHRGGKQLVLF